MRKDLGNNVFCRMQNEAAVVVECYCNCDDCYEDVDESFHREVRSHFYTQELTFQK